MGIRDNINNWLDKREAAKKKAEEEYYLETQRKAEEAKIELKKLNELEKNEEIINAVQKKKEKMKKKSSVYFDTKQFDESFNKTFKL